MSQTPPIGPNNGSSSFQKPEKPLDKLIRRIHRPIGVSASTSKHSQERKYERVVSSSSPLGQAILMQLETKTRKEADFALLFKDQYAFSTSLGFFAQELEVTDDEFLHFLKAALKIEDQKLKPIEIAEKAIHAFPDYVCQNLEKLKLADPKDRLNLAKSILKMFPQFGQPNFFHAFNFVSTDKALTDQLISFITLRSIMLLTCDFQRAFQEKERSEKLHSLSSCFEKYLKETPMLLEALSTIQDRVLKQELDNTIIPEFQFLEEKIGLKIVDIFNAFNRLLVEILLDQKGSINTQESVDSFLFSLRSQPDEEFQTLAMHLENQTALRMLQSKFGLPIEQIKTLIEEEILRREQLG